MKLVLLRYYGESQHSFRPNGSFTSAAIDIQNFALACLDRRQNQDVGISVLKRFCSPLEHMEMDRRIQAAPEPK